MLKVFPSPDQTDVCYSVSVHLCPSKLRSAGADSFEMLQVGIIHFRRELPSFLS